MGGQGRRRRELQFQACFGTKLLLKLLFHTSQISNDIVIQTLVSCIAVNIDVPCLPAWRGSKGEDLS
jgi:hypothetical protein